MAVRTTSEAVEGIIEVDATIPVTPFIEVASNLVTRVCGDSDYDAETFELIERWLAAHFYAIRDIRVASERAGEVAQSFQYKVGLNLQVTIYGQQAAMLDTDGNLAALSKRAEDGKRGGTRVLWLGTEHVTADDIDPDYDD